MTEMIQPFSSGSEFSDWEEHNCAVCKKGWSEEQESSEGLGPCDLDNALSMAYVGEGVITQEQYDRLGLPEYRCKEFDPSPDYQPTPILKLL